MKLLRESLIDEAPEKVGRFKISSRPRDGVVEYTDDKTHVVVRFYNGGPGVEVKFSSKDIICDHFKMGGDYSEKYIENVLRGIARVIDKDLPALWSKIRPLDIFCLLYHYQTTKSAWVEGKLADAIREVIDNA